MIPEMATSMSAEEEELYRLTWEAIQDVDAGRVVDHSAVDSNSHFRFSGDFAALPFGSARRD
jgi:hypothetical protein